MRSLPQKVVEGLSTKSAKIRALAEAGFARTEIAQFLGVRYQHVRNVLVQSGVASAPRESSGNRLAKIANELWPMDRLIQAGFERISECEANGAGSFVFSSKAPSIAGVYAFAVDGFIQYVGLSQSGLQTTMGHYVYGHANQKTRARVKQLMLASLADGKCVSLLVAYPPLLDWNGLPIDGPAGLEAGLIRKIRPPWNVQGKG